MTGSGGHEDRMARHEAGGVGSCLCRSGQVSESCRGGRWATPGEGSADRSRPRDVVKPGAGGQDESSDREVLAGLVERVTFHNPENGFCVLRTKARGHRDLVTVVGHAAMVGPGEWITASGEWVNDRTHGQQFKARFMRTSEPSSVEGIEKYLGSGMIRGIGPVYARKLVRGVRREGLRCH